MTHDEIKARTREVLARTLKTDPSKISDGASQTELSGWDSVHHMNVVVALENDFEIEFDDTELPKLTSLPAIVAAVEKHLAGGG